jgi:hypothetical protein
VQDKSYSKEYIKERTLELYKSLPMDKEERIKQIKVRDEIIELNYKFFGYVATSTYVENASYEDKFQTALMSFMGMWWKFGWTPRYRDDLSFAVFFKPRISEEIRRFLNTFSYTQKRKLCIKVASQLDKNWTDVTYDDLALVTLPEDDMLALKAILGSKHPQDVSELEFFVSSAAPIQGVEKYRNYRYDSIEEMLIQEMISEESQLNDKQLREISDLYSIPMLELKSALPRALKILHDRLTNNLYE